MKRVLIPIWMRLALNAYSSGDYIRAEKYFRRIQAADPARPGIRHNLALTAMGRGDFAAAEPLLLAELRECGPLYLRIKVLGDLYYGWGRFRQASCCYSRAVEDPEAPACDMGFLRQRIDICNDETAADSALRSGKLYHEGNAALARGDAGAALALFEDAVKLDPTNHPALNNIGVIRMNHSRDYSGALEAFDRAYRIQPVEIVRANAARARAMVKGK